VQACSSVGYRLAYGIAEPTARFFRSRLEAEGRAGGGTLVWIGAERSDGDKWLWSSGRILWFLPKRGRFLHVLFGFHFVNVIRFLFDYLHNYLDLNKKERRWQEEKKKRKENIHYSKNAQYI